MCKRNKKIGKLTLLLTFCFFIVAFLNDTASSDDTQLSTGAGGDIIKVEVIGNEIVGLNTLTNTRVVEKLKEGELVTSALSKGKIGAILTNRRIMGINANNNTWSSFETFFNKEVFPDEIKVSSNMAVAIAKRRVYAYTSDSNEWKFELISLLEQTLSSEINDNLIFVRTSTRLLAFSFHKGRWFPQNIYTGDVVMDTAIGENFITATINNNLLDNRIVTFNAKEGAWREERVKHGANQGAIDPSSPSKWQVETTPANENEAPEDPESKS